MGTIQRPKVKATNYISKLIRVCLFDKHFYSYAEAELNCEFNGKTYNLLQTAKVSKPGRHLAAALGISEDDDVLFGMFGYGHPNDLIDNNKGSAMCIYPIRKINQVFTLNIETCFKGIGKTGPEHISTPRNCLSTVCIFSLNLQLIIKLTTQISKIKINHLCCIYELSITPFIISNDYKLCIL